MGYYYYKSDGPDLISIIVCLLIWAVIAVTAVYFFVYLLIAIGVITAIFGSVIAIKNNAVALIHAIRAYGRAPKPQSWSFLPAFMYRWFKISVEASKEGWLLNTQCIVKGFKKAGYFRLFSPKKWYNIFLSISVILAGTIVTGAIIALYFLIGFAFQIAVLGALVAMLLVVAVMGVLASLIYAIAHFISILSKRRVALRVRTFPRYIVRHGFKDIFTVISLQFEKANNAFSNAVSNLKGSKLFSQAMISSLSIILFIHLLTVILIMVEFIPYILIVSILWVVCSLTNKGFK